MQGLQDPCQVQLPFFFVFFWNFNSGESLSTTPSLPLNPRYQCHLKESSASGFRLDVVEPGRLRNLVHLSLPFIRLTPTEMRDYFTVLARSVSGNHKEEARALQQQSQKLKLELDNQRRQHEEELK